MKAFTTSSILLLLLVSCQAPAPNSKADRALKILRGVGDAILRIDGLMAVREYAPELELLLNPNGDELITLAEVEAASEAIMADPELSALLLATAIYLQKR